MTEFKSLISIVLFAIVGWSIYSSMSSNSNSPGATTTTIGQDAVSMGAPAKDGQLTFTADSPLCGFKHVGSDGFGGYGATAQGQFCRVHVVILNHSTTSADFFASNQYAYDAAGRKFTADETADTYGNPDSGLSGTSINPGNSVNGFVFYDIPAGDTPTSFEFHDSAFSGGILVSR